MPMIFRTLLLGALALCAQAQQPREYRIGMLMPAPFAAAGYFKAFEDELARLGFVEGKNLRVTRRGADAEALAALAAARPDVLVTEGTRFTQALRRAMPTLPIVFAGAADPVRSGLVTALSHPGGHVTGVVNLECELVRKRLEVMREILPNPRRLVLITPKLDPPICPIAPEVLRQLGVTVFEDATAGDDEFRGYLEQVMRSKPDGIVGTAISGDDSDRSAQVAREAFRNVPLAADGDGWTEEAALIALKPDRSEVHRRAASQVARILRGTPAGEIPVETATRFHLTVNLRRAAQLGVRVPQTVLLRADRVVE